MLVAVCCRDGWMVDHHHRHRPHLNCCNRTMHVTSSTLYTCVFGLLFSLLVVGTQSSLVEPLQPTPVSANVNGATAAAGASGSQPGGWCVTVMSLAQCLHIIMSLS